MRYYDKTVESMSFIAYVLSDVKSEKKFRQALLRHLEAEDLASQFPQLLDPSLPMAKCKKELQAFAKREEALTDARWKEAARTAERLGLSAQRRDELMNGREYLLRQREGAVELLQDSSPSVLRSVLLEGATCSAREWWAEHVELTTEEEGYRLSLMNVEGECLVLSFRSAREIVCPLHAVSEIATQVFFDFVSTPWAFLSQYAEGILSHMEDGCANEKEIKLRPLVRYLTDEEKTRPPKLFADAAERHGAGEVLEKYAPKRRKLFRVLSKQRYEPLWRELFSLLEESQRGYPTLAEQTVSEADAAEHRAFVTERMHAHGFAGEYPHFYREAPFRRPRLLRSFDEIFFVGFEKHAVHHVFCHMVTVGEREDVGELYLCGAVFRKSAEEETDFYSCLFDRRGKTAASAVTTVLLAQQSEEAWQEKRRLAADVAVKTALLRPLTRRERESRPRLCSGKGLLLGMFLFMSVFFGVGMTLGMMLIDFLTVMITTGSFALFAEQFFEVPWWLIGVCAGVLFGAAMTLLELLQRRK